MQILGYADADIGLPPLLRPTCIRRPLRVVTSITKCSKFQTKVGLIPLSRCWLLNFILYLLTWVAPKQKLHHHHSIELMNIIRSSLQSICSMSRSYVAIHFMSWRSLLTWVAPKIQKHHDLDLISPLKCMRVSCHPQRNDVHKWELS